MYTRQMLLAALGLTLLCLLAVNTTGAQDGAVSPAPAAGGLGPLALAQSGLISPSRYFASNSAITFTPVAQGFSYGPGDLGQTRSGRFFILVDFSPTGQQTLGLLVSSFDQALLLDYLNALRLYFEAVPVPPGAWPGFGSEGYRDDVYYIERETGDIEVELALLPRGSINPGQDYAVYFAVDPTLYQQGQAHLYRSPSWTSIHTWAVADRGSILYTLWRNEPGAYVGERQHGAGQAVPQPMADDIAPNTANYNALITGQQSGSRYRLYGGFTAQPYTITPPVNVNVNLACPLPPRMVVGQPGIVDNSSPLPNRLRSSPSLSGAQIGLMRTNEIFTVIGGPVCANSILWWRVNYNGRVAWTAEGEGGIYYIRPY